MKVLVFDDTEKQRKAAAVQLKAHEVTVVATYDEAEKALSSTPAFDVVLTDLLVPASARNQGDRGQKYVGQEMPLGSIIALLALARGVKMVAVVSDMNHHAHPASAAFDVFGLRSDRVDTIGEGVKLLCLSYNVTRFVDENTFEDVNLSREELDAKHPWQAFVGPLGLTEVKAWDDVLSELVTGKKPERERQ